MPSNSPDSFTSLSSSLPCIAFYKSFTWFEETIYRRRLQVLSFLELVLLIIRPIVASGRFVNPILVKAISFLSFHCSLWHKRAARSLSLFSRRHINNAKILLRGLSVTKLCVETRTDCHCICQYFVNGIRGKRTILSITSCRNSFFFSFFFLTKIGVRSILLSKFFFPPKWSHLGWMLP